eukprot:gene11318-15181_t
MEELNLTDIEEGKSKKKKDNRKTKSTNPKKLQRLNKILNITRKKSLYLKTQDKYDNEAKDEIDSSFDEENPLPKDQILENVLDNLSNLENEYNMKIISYLLCIGSILSSICGVILILFALGKTPVFQNFTVNKPLFGSSFIFFVPTFAWLIYKYLPCTSEMKKSRHELRKFRRRMNRFRRIRSAIYHGEEPEALQDERDDNKPPVTAKEIIARTSMVFQNTNNRFSIRNGKGNGNNSFDRKSTILRNNDSIRNNSINITAPNSRQSSIKIAPSNSQSNLLNHSINDSKNIAGNLSRQPSIRQADSGRIKKSVSVKFNV